MSRTLVIVAVVLGMCAGQTLVGFAQTGPRTQQEPEFTQASQVVEASQRFSSTSLRPSATSPAARAAPASDNRAKRAKSGFMEPMVAA